MYFTASCACKAVVYNGKTKIQTLNIFFRLDLFFFYQNTRKHRYETTNFYPEIAHYITAFTEHTQKPS